MENEREEFYDVEIDMSKMLNGISYLDDIFYLKELQNRTLYINDDIEQSTIIETVKNIIRYNKEDAGIPVEKRKPILLFLTSNGGDVDSGFELIDAIMTSVTPVYTINLGYQYSMGFLIGIAGHKRFAMPNAKILIHDGTNFVFNSSGKVQDQIEFQRRVEDRIKAYILSRSSINEEEYNSKLRVEWYLFADEAKEKGLVDYIIGVDCGIGDIL